MSERIWFYVFDGNTCDCEFDAPVIVASTTPKSTELDFRLNLSIPDPEGLDGSATENQIASVLSLWPHLPKSLSFKNCHALLCYRDYAGTLLDLVFEDEPPKNFDEWTKIVIAMVSYYPEVARDVRLWSERRYRNQLGPPRIITSKHFQEIVTACAKLHRKWGELTVRV